MDNKIEKISVSAFCFIIPNRASGLDEDGWIDQEDMKKFIKRAFEINNTEIDPKCKLVEVWIHSTDLNTDNLDCHGGCITLDDGRLVRIYADARYIPSTFLERRKEGAKIKYNIDAWIQISDEESRDVILELDLQLCQLESRYRHCGPFEDAYRRVTS